MNAKDTEYPEDAEKIEWQEPRPFERAVLIEEEQPYWRLRVGK